MSSATRRKTAGRKAAASTTAPGRKSPASVEMQLDSQPDGRAERGEEPGDHEDESEDGVDSDGMAAATGAAAASKPRRPGGQGRRKIPIEYVADKGKRAVTFSKRRAGLFTKARELSVLTGTALLLLVVSESGVVYTYTTEAFEPMVTQPSGKNMIAACLNGTVKIEPAPPVPRGSKRGGNVILRDAFSKPEDHESRPFTSTSAASDGIPPVSAARGPRAQGARSDSSSPDTGSIYEHSGYSYALDPSFLHAGPSTEPYAAGAGSEITQAPETSAGPGRRVASPIGGAGSASIPVATDDVSEDECERRLRRLRRSLSIERRFENSDAFGNALPPLPLPLPLPQALPPLPEPRAGYAHDVGPSAGADAGPSQWRAVHDRFASQSTGERVGYAHTVDSWERFNRLNPIRSGERSTSTTRRMGGQSLSLPALDETVSHPP